MSTTSREWLFAFVIVAICVGLWFLDLAKIPQAPEGLHSRGLVVSTDNNRVRTHMIVKTGEQILTVKLLDGEFKDREFNIVNRLTGKMELDEFYEPGATILVEYDLVNEQPSNGLARGHYRIHLQVLLLALFAFLLVAVGGITGFNALLSFVFVAMVLWKLYFPLLLKGFAPISTGLAVVTVLTAVITFSVGGLNRRGTAAFIGSMLGILLTCVLGVWFTHAFRLHGAVQPFAETLLYSGYYDLNLTNIFTASIFIASSGAVMDLAMDIAASMEEIKRNNSSIGMAAHIQSGLRVGRAALGTMATTLLLAYSISHGTMFMFFLAKGLPAVNILNAPFVSAEVLNILIGSFGLITVAPLTAVISGLIYRAK